MTIIKLDAIRKQADEIRKMTIALERAEYKLNAVEKVEVEERIIKACSDLYEISLVDSSLPIRRR